MRGDNSSSSSLHQDQVTVYILVVELTAAWPLQVLWYLLNSRHASNDPASLDLLLRSHIIQQYARMCNVKHIWSDTTWLVSVEFSFWFEWICNEIIWRLFSLVSPGVIVKCNRFEWVDTKIDVQSIVGELVLLVLWWVILFVVVWLHLFFCFNLRQSWNERLSFGDVHRFIGQLHILLLVLSKLRKDDRRYHS